MTITTITCVTITCTGCGVTPEGDDEYEPHYPNAADAITALTDDSDPARSWSTDGDRHLCPNCQCTRHGHLWQPPERCRCDGAIQLPGHDTPCPLVHRDCARCLHTQDIDPTTPASPRN